MQDNMEFAQILQIQDLSRIVEFDGDLGHAEHDTGLPGLREREPPGGPDRAQRVGAVVAHAGHDQTDGPVRHG